MPTTSLWGLPFLGLLMSIAVLPALAPGMWHRRMEWITALWCLVLLVPMAVLAGPAAAAATVWRTLLDEYLPLISLLFALYVAGGGVLIDGGRFGTPAGNTALLALGAVLAGVLGTTGAAMVLIRPLLRANAHRRRRAHFAVFFILLVANAGGGTTPLGDPPLYVGFLLGVPFLWPLLHLAIPLLVTILPLLAVFFLIDRHLCRGEPPPPPPPRLRIEGGINLVLVAAVATLVLAQGFWHAGQITLLGEAVDMTLLASIVGCMAVGVASLLVTPMAIREENFFRWAPLHEVAVLFAGLFITMAPVLTMLAEGAHGPLGGLLSITRAASGAPVPALDFWLAGLLSGFLDSAPAYLVFFHQAGGDARVLTGSHAATLVAISAGTVLFGGLSYVGNAPNMMVRAIAVHQAVRMPGFFAYVGIAAVLLLPGLLVITWWLT